MPAAEFTQILSEAQGQTCGRQWKAVVFDVDGTLYRLKPLKRAVQIRYLRRHWYRPREAWIVHRAVSGYRHAIDALRDVPVDGKDLKEKQIEIAARAARLPQEWIRNCVRRWMEEEPLDLLKKFRFEGIVDLVTEFRERGIRLGIFSDFPAEKKLSALGVAEYFEVVLSAQDKLVQRFKPDPLGLRVALELLGVKPGEAIYVGDRLSIDGVAAGRAGVRFHLAGDGHQDPVTSLRDLRELVLSRVDG